MDNDKVINVLNDLIETCRDGQNGFKEAAENATSSGLKSFFYATSQERGRFVGELQEQVRTLGGDPEKKGSMAGAVHRAWIDVKGTLTGKDDHSILNEAERGEDSAVSAYQNANKEALPANCKRMIERQHLEVKAVHDRVKKMRDAQSASAGGK